MLVRERCGGRQETLREQDGVALVRGGGREYRGGVEVSCWAKKKLVPSNLFEDTRHDFKGLKATGVPSEDGDKAFDPETFAAAPSAPAGLQIVQI